MSAPLRSWNQQEKFLQAIHRSVAMELTKINRVSSDGYSKYEVQLKSSKPFNFKNRMINMRRRIHSMLSVLVGLIFIQSALRKIISSQEMLDRMDFIGPYSDKLLVLGCIEITAAILFMIPRTAILGTLLLVAYMGGAIATNLELGRSLWPPILVSSLLWIVALFCNPELTHKISGRGGKSSQMHNETFRSL